MSRIQNPGETFYLKTHKPKAGVVGGGPRGGVHDWANSVASGKPYQYRNVKSTYMFC